MRMISTRIMWISCFSQVMGRHKTFCWQLKVLDNRIQRNHSISVEHSYLPNTRLLPPVLTCSINTFMKTAVHLRLCWRHGWASNACCHFFFQDIAPLFNVDKWSVFNSYCLFDILHISDTQMRKQAKHKSIFDCLLAHGHCACIIYS